MSVDGLTVSQVSQSYNEMKRPINVFFFIYNSPSGHKNGRALPCS